MSNFCRIGFGLLVVLVSCRPNQEFQRSTRPADDVRVALAREFDANRALSDLEYFTRFWRIAGGPGYDSCLSRLQTGLRALERIQDDGHPSLRSEILVDPLERNVWVPVGATLSMESPEVRQLHSFDATPVMLCENSFPADLSAPLTYVPGGNKEEHYTQTDVRGKLVLCDAPASSAYRIALYLGAVGIISCHVPAYNRPAEHPDIIAESGLPFDEVRRPFALNISPRSADDLKRQLRSEQVVLHVKVETSFIKSSLKTLVAEIPGRIKPEERVVIVAHLDHYKPGANDNASGAAALLEICRSITTSIRLGRLLPPARTITFLWVDEYRGTEAWIKRQGDNLDKVMAAFVLDMVGGDPNKTGGSFRVERMPDPGAVWFRPPEQHSGWGAGMWDKSRLFGSFLNDYYLSIIGSQSAATGWKTASNVWEGGSDHDPFLWRKVPAILSWHFPDFAYHTSLDRIENISVSELKNAGSSIAFAAYQLALGSDEVAQQTLLSVDSAWTKRFEYIKLLLKMELEEAQSGNTESLAATKALEREIMEAWALWYDQALDSILRIPAAQPSAALEDGVRRARERVGNELRDTKAAFGL